MIKDQQQQYHDELQQRIDEVLYYVWDPIGVGFDIPEARDEYSSYVFNIYKAVLADKSVEEIAAILTRVADELMGHSSKMEREKEVAEIIWWWGDYLKEKYKN